MDAIINSGAYMVSQEDWHTLYNYAASTDSRVNQLETRSSIFACKPDVDTLVGQCHTIRKQLDLIYKSLGVEPYDSYGELRPDEEILADLAVALMRINISIDDIFGE